MIEQGNALEDSGRPAEALRCYEAAVVLAPGLARAHLNCGNALLAMGDVQAALSAYESALRLDSRYAAAHFNVGNAHMRRGDSSSALLAYGQAVECNPDFADAVIARGRALATANRYTEAEHCLREATTRFPSTFGVHASLGEFLLQTQRPNEAAAYLVKALELDPTYRDLYLPLASALKEAGQLELAASYCVRAVPLFERSAADLLEIGNTLLACGKAEESIAAYRRAIAILPALSAAHYNLGVALQQVDRHDAAVGSFAEALRHDPGLVEAHLNRGNSLRALGRHTAAIESYREALRINPDYAASHRNLGDIYHEQRRWPEAIESYRAALKLDPESSEVRLNLGNVLNVAGRRDEAVESYASLIRTDPDRAEAHLNLGNLWLEAGDLQGAISSYRHALKVNPSYVEAYTALLFSLAHDEMVSPLELLAEHRRFGRQFEDPLSIAWPSHVNKKDPERQLRLGILSADLRDHPIAYFFEPLLASLKRSPGLSLHAFYNHPAEDAVSSRLRSDFASWRNVSRLADAELAAAIQAESIDILIDLSGHTAGHRLLALARKPAPVQASWMGYPGTTGLTAVDYYICDPHFLPVDDFSSQFTEHLLHLPANAPFLPDFRAPSVTALPALSNGYLTFGSFNRPSKIRPPTVALWASLLRAIPNARLLLAAMPADGAPEWLLKQLASEGVARERIRIVPRTDRARYLAMHGEVDVCLDTLPYAGGTTTTHALWMGVPTLTLAGATPAGRQGAAIMGHFVLEDFVVDTAEAFVRRGIELTNDLESLASLRLELRTRMTNTHARQPHVIAEALERALREAWRVWCNGTPVKNIHC